MKARRTLVAVAGLVLILAEQASLQEKPAGGKSGAAADKETKKEKKDLPLAGERTVAFTTDEGSWISLDVSPDGKQILFELLGDLYTVPIGGGDTKRIIDGMAFDTQPRYSPDGSKIVFISDRSGADNLWVSNADGSEPRAITKDKTQTFRSPEWTPDGNYIIASRLTGPPPVMSLFLYHVDGGSGVKLTGSSDEQKNLFALGPAFGKDPRYVYFTERTQAGSVYNQMSFRWQLGVYDRHTGQNYRQSDELGSAMRPVLSPDGRWLVYATRWDAQTGFRVRDMQSGDDSWLLYPVQRDDQESASTRDLMPGASFTPDSKSLVASYDGKIWRVAVPTGEVTPVPFNAKVDLKLGPKVAFDYPLTEGLVRAQQIRHPRLSPDGRKLAFTALERVYVMDYPGGSAKRISTSSVAEHHPTWSPDGRHVLYVTWADDEGGHVYRWPADGGAPEKLTRTASFYSEPVYSPDGQRIVVVRGPRMERQEDFSPTGRGGQALELVWLPSTGGEATLIAPYRGEGRPHFSNDPSRIFAWEGKRGLVSFRFDGTDRRVHVKVTGYKSPNAEEPNPASDVIVGPDGEHALVDAETRVYMITIPMVGGDNAPTVSVASPDGASVPVKKLTNVGGEFIDWAAKGKAVTYALGHTFFRYDLDAAKAAEDRQKAEEKKKEDQARSTKDEGRSKSEGSSEKEDDAEKEKKKPAYEATETEVVVEVPRAKPSGTVVLRGARIITMASAMDSLEPSRPAGGKSAPSGADPRASASGGRAPRAGSIDVIENGAIVIRDNRIAEVGPSDRVNAPADAKIIDVSGKTIMPGLVDIHAHIWPAWDIHKTQIWEYLANLAYGVTTTRDPQTATTDILAYRDMVETGQILGPRVFGTGPGVFSSDNVQSLEDSQDVLKRYSKYWDTKTIKQYMAGNRQQRQWLIMAAREQKLMPTLEGGLDLKLNLTQIIDGYPGLEHTLPITPLYKDVVQLVAQAGIVYTPTLLVQYGGPWAENYFYENGHDLHTDPKLRRFTPHRDLDESVLRRPWFHEQEYSFPQAAKVLADVIKAGGRVGLGGHGQRQGIQCHWELWAIQSGGMPNHDALKVATIFGAEAIGFGKDLGSLEKGKLADLIVLDRNPLDDIRNTNSVRMVMKNGELYDAETLDQVWPQQKKLPRQYWWDLEPPVRKGAPSPPAVKKILTNTNP
jgi:Tol biopolymer transport system component/imidazolonepropionase-like amidohydrolase